MRRALPLAFLLLLACAAPATANTPVFGFNDLALTHGQAEGPVAALLARTGAQAYRVDLNWSLTEPSPGQWRWDEMDRTYRRVLAGGVRPVIVVGSAPRWAQAGSFGACGLVGAVQACHAPPSRAHLGDWSDFLRRAAARYPAARGFEVFNEPNIAEYNWRPKADPEYYAVVLRRAYAAIKAARPRMPVISGGVSPVNYHQLPNSITPASFLRRFYAAGGRGAMDAIGVHLYAFPQDPRPPNSPYHQLLSVLRSARAAGGDTRTPFWSTELGYHTGSSGIGGVSPARQATYLAAELRSALAQPDIGMVLVNSLVDSGNNRAQLVDSFGLVDPQLRPKPALAAVAAVVPPRMIVGRIARSVRIICPLRRTRRGRRRIRCRRSTTARVQLSKPSRVTVAFKRRRHRTRRFTRSLARGYTALRISGRVRGRRLARGRYSLLVRGRDIHGNRTDLVRRRLRIR